MGQTGLNYSCD